ncbi:MAG: enoyl-CoA hydratase/isomerase family protein [Chloroflexi bacterium]|nr:enoyl-CoA hydratase/isomerase family protein [Chloroflexota bacterium]
MTTYRIDNAVVIGAGTMGAALAAHIANAGIQTTLLDISPGELLPEEENKGLSLEDPIVRNRIVREGWQRCISARPANLFSPEVANRVTLGNLEDDFEIVGNADWIFEAIVENLEIKQDLMARIDKVRGPKAIVTTNTSGIPVSQIAEGRSNSLQENFLGTHFFNPPRYLKLLELIPHPKTNEDLIEFMREFCATTLGKGVVLCKDTPNFIGNRIFSIAASIALAYGFDNGYSIEEIDVISGPAIGRPKTATFRLMDLVGLDISTHVSANLYDAIPGDPYRELLRHPKTKDLMAEMISRGWIGNKSGQGFYKKKMVDGKKEFWILNRETFEYVAPVKPRFDSIGQARSKDSFEEQLATLVYADDRAGKFVWHLLSRTLAYSASVVPEISDDVVSIDKACKWGFSWRLGPFEIWDAIGVRRSVDRMAEEMVEIPAWVNKMLAGGSETFYQKEGGRVIGFYDIDQEKYSPLAKDPKEISIMDMKAQGKELLANSSACLLDMDEAVLLLEFNNPSTANAIDEDILLMLNHALDELDKPQWRALVIGNQGKHFSAGANIFTMAVAAQQEDFEMLETAVSAMQDLMQRMRYSPKPVVVAPFGMTLAGGCEVILAGSRIVAAAESYIGLIEVGVGLVPAGGGTTATVRRLINPVMRTRNADVLPHMQRAFEQIALAKVAESALQAQEMGYLAAQDRIVMNSDYLLAEAKRTALEMVAGGYHPPAPGKIWASGRDVLADLKLFVWGMMDAGYATEHDGVVSNHLANVLSGGDLTAPGWVPEQYFLDLEREAILALFHEEKSIARMWHMLQNKKPLRN